MEYVNTIVLAFIQAATEFLPISSSGHLQVYRFVFDIPNESKLTFDIVLHFGTMLATIFYFRKEISAILKSLSKQKAVVPNSGLRVSDQIYTRYYLMYILVASVPIGIIGVLAKDKIESVFDNLLLVGGGFLYTTILLFSMLYLKEKEGVSKPNLKLAIIVGLFQMVAILPGISRSGSCIFAGLLAGANRKFASEFAFLVSLPAISGATLFAIRDVILMDVQLDWTLMSIGLFFAFVFGWIFLNLLLAILKRGKLYLFASYTAFLAIYCFLEMT